MSYETFIFEATLTNVGAGYLGIYIPKDVAKKLGKFKGRKVVVHIYVPKESASTKRSNDTC